MRGGRAPLARTIFCILVVRWSYYMDIITFLLLLIYFFFPFLRFSLFFPFLFFIPFSLNFLLWAEFFSPPLKGGGRGSKYILTCNLWHIFSSSVNISRQFIYRKDRKTTISSSLIILNWECSALKQWLLIHCSVCAGCVCVSCCRYTNISYLHHQSSWGTQT